MVRAWTQVSVFVVSTLLAVSGMAQTGSPTRPAGQEAPKTTSSDETTSSSKIPVVTSKYVTGGVITSIFGLGIGHGIEGRYGDKGWIFTATEATGYAMMIAGCNDRKDRDGDGDKECNNAGLAAAGAVLAIGFHVWEIVDIWTGATPVDSAPVAFFMPIQDTTGIGVAWRF